MPMAGVVTEAVGEAEQDIPEGTLDVQFPVDIPVATGGMAPEDLVNLPHTAASRVIAEGDTMEVPVGHIMEDTVEVMFRDITMDDITITEDIMEAITGTIIQDMPHMEQPSGFFSAG
jgi:hypothetical protein